MATSQVDFGKKERDVLVGAGHLVLLRAADPETAEIAKVLALLLALTIMRKVETDKARLRFGAAFKENFG